jgi:hypothetical protein
LADNGRHELTFCAVASVLVSISQVSTIVF